MNLMLPYLRSDSAFHCVKMCQLIGSSPLLASPVQLLFSSLLHPLLFLNQSLMYFGLFRVSLPSCCQVREQMQASSHQGKRYYYIILLSLFKCFNVQTAQAWTGSYDTEQEMIYKWRNRGNRSCARSHREIMAGSEVSWLLTPDF